MPDDTSITFLYYSWIDNENSPAYGLTNKVLVFLKKEDSYHLGIDLKDHEFSNKKKMIDFAWDELKRNWNKIPKKIRDNLIAEIPKEKRY